MSLTDAWQSLQREIAELRALIPASGVTAHSWATITSTDPLRLRLDGASDPLDLTPQTLTGGHLVGQRVWVALYGRTARRVVILGASPTGWRPHGGTLAANVKVVLPIEWCIVNGCIYWRGQFYKTGGWTIGSANPVITNLPAAVRPVGGYLTPLTAAIDGTTQASVIINDQGVMNLFTGMAAGWPVIGGSYPQL